MPSAISAIVPRKDEGTADDKHYITQFCNSLHELPIHHIRLMQYKLGQSYSIESRGE